MFVFGQYVVQYTLLQKMAERCMNSKKKKWYQVHFDQFVVL